VAGNGTYLTRDAILAVHDLEFDDLSVPEWGGVIRIRTMTAAEREEYEQELAEQQKAGSLENVRASLVAACAVDAEGNRLFKSADIQLLGEKSNTALIRVFDACRRLNAMTAQEVKAMEKNSGPQPSAGSLSA
jgi:hypothetical protein